MAQSKPAKVIVYGDDAQAVDHFDDQMDGWVRLLYKVTMLGKRILQLDYKYHDEKGWHVVFDGATDAASQVIISTAKLNSFGGVRIGDGAGDVAHIKHGTEKNSSNNNQVTIVIDKKLPPSATLEDTHLGFMKLFKAEQGRRVVEDCHEPVPLELSELMTGKIT